MLFSGAIFSLAILLVGLSGCRSNPGQDPVSPGSFHGVVVLENYRASFSPCDRDERWFMTTDSLAPPSDKLISKADSLPPVYASADQTYRTLDSFTVRKNVPVRYPRFGKASPLASDSIYNPLSARTDVSPDTLEIATIEATGYASEQRKFGPRGLYDRFFTVGRVTSSSPGRNCSFLSF
jgi:hypothetical protein